MADRIATLDGVDLPVQFSYRPPVKLKRQSIVKTHGGVRIQTPPDSHQLVAGDSEIEWSIEAITKAEWATLKTQYEAELLADLPFTGYWDDTYTVKWTRFGNPDVSKTHFNVTGAFRVVSFD